MSITKLKKTSLDNDIKTLPDTLVGQATYLKGHFDKNTYQILTDVVNPLIDNLASITPTDSGSENIGSAPIKGVNGNTVHAQISSLKDISDNIVMGTIPDNSITGDKIVDLTITPEKMARDMVKHFNGSATFTNNVVNITVPNAGVDNYTVTFTAPSNYVATNTYRINNTVVTVVDLNGNPLKKAWVSGSPVTIQVVGNKAFFKAGGEFSSDDLLPMDRVEILYDDDSDYDVTQIQTIPLRGSYGYFYNNGDFLIVQSSSNKDICKVSTVTNTLISKITDANLLGLRVANELIFGIKANGVFDIYDFELNKLQTITLTNMITSRYDEILINYFDNRYLFTGYECSITTDQDFNKIAYRLAVSEVYHTYLISICDGYIFTHECVMDKDLNVLVLTSNISSDVLKAQPILNSNYYIKPIGTHLAELYQYNKTTNTFDLVKEFTSKLWEFNKAIKLGNKILIATGLNDSNPLLSRTFFHELNVTTLDLKLVGSVQGSLHDNNNIPHYGFTQFKGGFAAVSHDSCIMKYIPRSKTYKIIEE